MLELQIQNVFRQSAGMKHGLNQKAFHRFLNSHEPLVKQVFSQKNKPGYAFINLPDDKRLVQKLNRYAKSQAGKWENIVVLGIGGSALGAIAVRDALLGPYHFLDASPKLFVVDNIDPELITKVLNSVDVKKTLFIVISKSGGTVEPMALYNIVLEELKNKFPKTYPKHLLFVTDPKGSLLREIGKREGVEMFEVPPKIGGRFSVLTAVGLLPLALAGVDIGKLMKGAADMRDFIKSKPTDNPALHLAALQFLMERKKQKNMVVMMPYSNQLFRLGDWYRQLLAESIGKNHKTGPTPVNALGATDQHSQLQLYNEGPNDKWFIFLTVQKFHNDVIMAGHLPKELDYLNGKKLSGVLSAAYEGTARALTQNHRPNVTIRFPKVDEKSLGEFFMLFEFQVALLGLLYKVDAFNQPGVEASKQITKSLLSK